jgi:transketolase
VRDIGMGLEVNLTNKAREIWAETLRLHKLAPGTRLASSLSDVEIFVSLYYGGVLRYRANEPLWEGRDRLIVSKGHGAISLYPILADLGYFAKDELDQIATEKTFLGVIPDSIVPGIETTNGSLGHGPGVSCGIALALKERKSKNSVFVVCGDGEMNSGAVWEAVMFGAFHKLDNLIMIIDDNKISMLGYQKDILGLNPIEEKLSAFGWDAIRVNGHDLNVLTENLMRFRDSRSQKPKALVADTVKGKGVSDLEKDSLCHVKTINAEEIDKILARLK